MPEIDGAIGAKIQAGEPPEPSTGAAVAVAGHESRGAIGSPAGLDTC